MRNNIKQILGILQEWLEREQEKFNEMPKYSKVEDEWTDSDTEKELQRGIILGIELAIDWIENNFDRGDTTKFQVSECWLAWKRIK